MSYKIDQMIAMLDEVLMRLDGIERHLNIKKEQPTKIGKPNLTVVTTDANVVEFSKDE